MDSIESQNEVVVTCDGAELKVPLPILEQCKTIKNLLDNTKNEDFVLLPTISSETFGIIWLSLEKPQNSKQIISQLVTEPQLLNFITTVDYLDINDLNQPSIKELAQRKLSPQEIEHVAINLPPKALPKLWALHPARTWLLNKYPNKPQKLGSGNLVFSPNNKYALLHDNSILRVFDTTNNKFEKLKGLGPFSSIESAFFSPKGRYVIAHINQDCVKWDISKEFELINNLSHGPACTLDSSTNKAQPFTTTRDNKYQISRSLPSNTIQISETTNDGLQPLSKLSVPDYLDSATFSPDEKWIILTSHYTFLGNPTYVKSVWNFETYKQLAKQAPDHIRLFMFAYANRSILPNFLVKKRALPEELQTVFKNMSSNIQEIVKSVAPQYSEVFLKKQIKNI